MDPMTITGGGGAYGVLLLLLILWSLAIRAKARIANVPGMGEHEGLGW